MSKSAKALDKYYTKDDVATACLERYLPLVPQEAKLIEPSAGGGSFMRAAAAAGREIHGFDILPEDTGIIKLDFLEDDVRDHLDIQDAVFVGNPPFGKKGLLAIAFINKCLELGGTVGFVLPVQFRKWSAQKQIIKGASLIMDEDLPEEAFSFNGKPYALRCSFQVWSTRHPQSKDLRMHMSPPTTHDDFEMWQFNRTKEAEKFFDYDWDFAVPRQGFYDYSFKALKKEDCDRKKQWIFFKAKTPEILERLKAIDFTSLSKLNSGTPGFGKADVIKEYTK
jgi:predicted RNA methylase